MQELKQVDNAQAEAAVNSAYDTDTDHLEEEEKKQAED